MFSFKILLLNFIEVDPNFVNELNQKLKDLERLETQKEVEEVSPTHEEEDISHELTDTVTNSQQVTQPIVINFEQSLYPCSHWNRERMRKEMARMAICYLLLFVQIILLTLLVLFYFKLL